MSEFEKFRLKLSNWAKSRLELDNPEYVETFFKRMKETNEDVERVINETRPLLKGPRTWRKLLTALLDVDQTMDKVKRSVRFAGFPPRASSAYLSNPGAWLVYHVDSWLIHAYGLLERLERLMTLTCRHVIRPKEKAEEAKAALIDDVKKMKAVIAGIRHTVAHGGGSVEALEAEELWEPYVLVGPDAWLNMTSSYYDSVAPRQAKWHAAIRQSTIQVFQVSEAWFRKLSEAAFGQD